METRLPPRHDVEPAERQDQKVSAPPGLLASVRTRGSDIAVGAKRQIANDAARAEAKAVIERWNEQLAASRDMLWSPKIRAALIAGTPWLDVFCPGCGTSRAIDLRKVDRHPLASVATLCGVRGVRNRRRCQGYSDCMRCRLRRRPRRRTCERALHAPYLEAATSPPPTVR
jgi:hypothetical protein